MWDQGDILLVTEWQVGGPELPIEFSRVSESRDSALTLVIDPDNGTRLPTRFAVSERTELETTISDVRNREGTSVDFIGYVNLIDHSQRCGVYSEASQIIREWALSNEFDAVVWTDLPSNFHDQAGIKFTVEEAVRYLHNLPERGTARAREYIVNAPDEIDTPLRRALKDDPWLQG